MGAAMLQNGVFKMANLAVGRLAILVENMKFVGDLLHLLIRR